MNENSFNFSRIFTYLINPARLLIRKFLVNMLKFLELLLD